MRKIIEANKKEINIVIQNVEGNKKVAEDIKTVQIGMKDFKDDQIKVNIQIENLKAGLNKLANFTSCLPN
jgi:hypothetical protein